MGYRSSHPDEQTVEEVKKDLKDNLDVSQLVEFSIDHCQQTVFSTAGGNSTDTGVGNGRQHSDILNILDSPCV